MDKASLYTRYLEERLSEITTVAELHEFIESEAKQRVEEADDKRLEENAYTSS